MKVLIVAGGTAGHILPALVVAEELRNEDKNTDILFITSRKMQDKELILKKGFALKSISSGKLRRYFSLLNFIDIFRIIIGFFQSLVVILKFKPNVIFSKGGYVSLPVVVAGRFLGKKIIIHESDFVLGLSNRLSLPFTNKLAVSYPVGVYKNVDPKKIFFSGNPLRKMNIEKKETDKVSTILVLGGSQGARKINFAIVDIIDELLDTYKVIHQAGELDIVKLEEKKKSLSEVMKRKYSLFSNIYNPEELNNIYNEADLVISRSGSVIFEIALFGKPAIIIPLAGHQEKNAAFFENNEAVLVIKNEDLSAGLLKKNIDKIAKSKKLRDKLSKNISKYANRDAALIVVKELLSLTKGS